MRVPKYVSESPELLAARAWEENTRWQTSTEVFEESLDRTKDWTICGVRCGVPESYSDLYNAPREVAA